MARPDLEGRHREGGARLRGQGQHPALDQGAGAPAAVRVSGGRAVRDSGLHGLPHVRRRRRLEPGCADLTDDRLDETSASSSRSPHLTCPSCVNPGSPDAAVRLARPAAPETARALPRSLQGHALAAVEPGGVRRLLLLALLVPLAAACGSGGHSTHVSSTSESSVQRWIRLEQLPEERGSGRRALREHRLYRVPHVRRLGHQRARRARPDGDRHAEVRHPLPDRPSRVPLLRGPRLGDAPVQVARGEAPPRARRLPGSLQGHALESGGMRRLVLLALLVPLGRGCGWLGSLAGGQAASSAHETLASQVMRGHSALDRAGASSTQGATRSQGLRHRRLHCVPHLRRLRGIEPRCARPDIDRPPAPRHRLPDRAPQVPVLREPGLADAAVRGARKAAPAPPGGLPRSLQGHSLTGTSDNPGECTSFSGSPAPPARRTRRG